MLLDLFAYMLVLLILFFYLFLKFVPSNSQSPYTVLILHLDTNRYYSRAYLSKIAVLRTILFKLVFAKIAKLIYSFFILSGLCLSY